jgi:hypothetical protein
MKIDDLATFNSSRSGRRTGSKKFLFDLVFGSGDGGAAVHPCNRIAPPLSTPRQLQDI